MGLRYSWEEMTDLLYRRYHDPAAILALDAEEGIALLQHAAELEQEQMLFARWVAGPQFSMGFDEFKAQLNRPPEKPAAAILDDVGNIMTAWEVQRHGNI